MRLLKRNRSPFQSCRHVVHDLALLVACAGCALLWPNPARAESPGPFLQKLQKALATGNPNKVLVVVRQDPSAPRGTVDSPEMQALARFISQCGKQQGSETAELEDDDLAQCVTVSKMPDPALVADVLQRNDAQAVLAVAWKPHRSKLVVRAALLNGKKTLWRGSTVVGDSGNAQTPSRATAGAAAQGLRNGRLGPGLAGAGSLSGLGPLSGLGMAANQGHGASGSANAAATAQTLPNLNERILAFVVDNVGQQVGNGQCWTLAAEALRQAGAQPPQGYDFGQEVELADLLPGDVLHFTNVILVTETAWYWYGAPDHVAVVAAVDGTALSIYHQNVNGNKTVRNDVIDLATLHSGTIEGYRAVDATSGAFK